MMRPNRHTRAENEIRHGRLLAGSDTERVWGWGTPAGKLRARRRAELIIQGSGLGPGMKVLEIGCGTGLFTELFVKSGCDLLAIDISPDLLFKARARNIPQASVNFVETSLEDAKNLGPFDAIIGSSILHHLDMPGALKKILSLLNSGGQMSFAEPNLLNPQVYLERRFSHWQMFSYTSPDETAFKRTKITRTLRESGFVNVEVTPFDWLHPSTPRMIIPLVMTIGRIMEQLPLVREFSGSLLIRANKP